MPVPTPQLGSYQHVAETKEDLEWADLVTVDLSLYNTPEGKKELANTLIHAVRDIGFFYVKNYNISQDRVARQFDMTRMLHELPMEEKEKFTPEGLMDGDFTGYISSHETILEPKTGLRSTVALYNISKPDEHCTQKHPDLINKNINELKDFYRSLHQEVLTPLLVLIAIGLELPENYFTDMHKWEDRSEDNMRYMKYGKRTEAEYKILEEGQVESFVVGHSDLGSMTLLFGQPVAGLQIRYHSDNTWKWVKPQEGTITINAGDALQFLTGGYIKNTIHRVNIPPKDQRHVDRLSLIYFAKTSSDVILRTAIESPVLQREGFTQNEFEKSGNPVPTMAEWALAKQKWQSTGLTDDDPDELNTATILPGYNEQAYT